MAAAFGKGGFDYTFDPPLSEDYICSICLLALREPVITTCGHLFCKSCLEEAFRRFGRVCPVDKNELDARDPFPNKHVERIILNSYVRCPNTGCALKIIVSDVENHSTECPYEEIRCTLTDCTERILRGKLHDHVSSECQWRNYKCVYCKENLPICKKWVHEQTCRRFPVKCTNGCNDHKTLPREELPTHLEKECPLTEVNCDYNDIGCSNKVIRQQLDDHIKRSTNKHLELACKKVFEMAETVNKLYEKFDNQTQELEALKKQNQEQQAQLRENLESQKRELNVLKMLEIQQTGLLLTRCEREKQIADKAAKRAPQKQKRDPKSVQIIGSVQTMPLEYTLDTELDVLKQLFQEQRQTFEQHNQQSATPFVKLNSGFVWRFPFTWTINRFLEVCEETRQRKGEISSDPFYTGAFGYRLRVFIKPLGRGCSKSAFGDCLYVENIQVGIVVVDGEYDSLLAWPFRRNLTVNLIRLVPYGYEVPEGNCRLFIRGQKKDEKVVASPCMSDVLSSGAYNLKITINDT